MKWRIKERVRLERAKGKKVYFDSRRLKGGNGDGGRRRGYERKAKEFNEEGGRGRREEGGRVRNVTFTFVFFFVCSV